MFSMFLNKIKDFLKRQVLKKIVFKYANANSGEGIVAIQNCPVGEKQQPL